MKSNKFIVSTIIVTLIVITLEDQFNLKQNPKPIQTQQQTNKNSTLAFECQIDSDCNELNVCTKNKCKHKSFFPATSREIVGLFCIVVGSALSNAGGIGGGGLLIPILILILKFETHEAIPISKLMIFTGALTAFIMGMKNKHPYRDAIALDYNIAGVLIPMILFGTIVGVTLNKIMPFSIILICLSIVLVVNTYKTFKTGFKNYEKENQERAELHKSNELEKNEKSNNTTLNRDEIADEETLSLKSTSQENVSQTESQSFEKKNINSGDSRLPEKDTHNTYGYTSGDLKDYGNNSAITENDKISVKENNKELIKEEMRKDRVILPLGKYHYMLITYVFLVFFTLLKGSEHSKSIIGVKPCSKPYWTIYFLFLPLALGITYIFSKKVLAEYKKRLEMGFPYHPTDIKWNIFIVIKYPIYAFIGGVLAGSLGIGGGLVLGPMLLEMGINPIISTATSNFLVLFTSSSTTIQFIIMGMMNFDYGFICTICSTIGSLIGTLAIQKLLKKTGRPSILIFSLAIVLGISTILIPWDTSIKIKQKVDAGINIWGINSAC